jgi:hypothetical protein
MPDPSTGEVVVPQDTDVKDTAAASSAEATTQDAKATGAEPSTADEGAKAPKSMLEAVKAAIAPAAKTEAADTDSAASSPDAKGEVKDGEPDSTAKVEEEPPFHKHPRWQEMVAARKAADARVKELEPEAETFRQFRSVVSQAGLKAEEIDQGFEIMALMKSDPAEAYKKLKPFMEQCESFVGTRLPADIQAKVDAGTVDLETAQELVRVRSKNALHETRTADAVEARKSEQQAETQRQAEAHITAVKTAVTTWEQQWKASDPDFAVKHSLVDAMFVKFLNDGKHTVRTPEDAVELAKEAKAEVEKTLKPVTRKMETKRSVGGGSSGNGAAPAPKTMKEAIALAAQGKYKSAA